MPRITVALCTYNRAKSGYLTQALQSIVDQTYKDTDIIVYDNASTDNTEDVVRSFSDSRIKYIKNERNIGLFGNLNKALDNCKTEYIVIFHDDDIMLPNMIETEVKAMDKYPDAAMCGQMWDNRIVIDSDGNVINKFSITKPCVKIFRRHQAIKACLRQCVLVAATPTMMFRSSFMDLNHIRFKTNKGPAADVILCMEINLLDSPIISIRTPIYKNRIHKSSESSIACLDHTWFTSRYYIVKWASSKGIDDNAIQCYRNYAIIDYLNNLVNSEPLDTSFRRIPYGLTYLVNEFAYSYKHGFNDHLNATIILSSSILAVANRSVSLGTYFKNRRIIKENIGITPAPWRELYWFIKYFICGRCINRTK